MQRISCLVYIFEFFLVCLTFTRSSSHSTIEVENLLPREVALVQFDSRPLADYWLASALWNKAYCKIHGHEFLFYKSLDGCRHGNEVLASPWCKVKTMIQAMEDYPAVKFFVYMDSDAIIDESNFNTSVTEFGGFMQRKLQWDPEQKPVIFNQDGPSWWCKLVDRVGYTQCLNAGTVAWFRSSLSTQVLSDWWDASMDPYEGNLLKRKFRLKWPWEQDRQMALYHRSPEHIQISSHPHLPRMPRQPVITGRDGMGKGWCFSHLPNTGCFISHYCANKSQKQHIVALQGRAEHKDKSSGFSEFGEAETGYGIHVNILKL